MNDRRAIAIHEAGHAVIARVLDYPSGGASIVANIEEMEAGHAMLDQPLDALTIWWDQRGKYGRNEDTAKRARVLISMAGAVAERVIIGHSQGGEGGDERETMWVLIDLYGEKEWERREARFLRHTETLVKRHRLRIERVADALMLHDTLTGDAINRIVSRH